MSVFGVDLGNLNSTVAITRHGGVDIVINDVSRRETTSIVSFGDHERHIGESGFDKYVRNASNTVFLLKRFIGMRMNDPLLDTERRFLTCSVIGDEEDRLMFEVNYAGERVTFYPEQVLAMLLDTLRSYVNREATVDPKHPALVRDCVLTVPCYYTAEQRRLLMQACEIADIHCMSLVNDTTAASVDYGIFRGASLAETEAEGQVVGIVDIGYGTSVFAVTRFWRGNLRVLARVYERNLGTRDIDYELLKHFAAETKRMYKVDVWENKRARLRLLQGCEKLRYLLSGNQVAALNVENVMDVDVNIPVFERSTMEGLCENLLDRFKALLQRGFEMSGVTPDMFHSIEMIGGGSRIPMFKRAAEEALGKAPSFTLNASETAARGAAITAAVFSPKFQVREFVVSDVCSYPVMLGYHMPDAQNPVSVPFLPDVNKVVPIQHIGDSFPKVLEIKIKRTTDFIIYAFYDPASPEVIDNVVPQNWLIGKWEIGTAPVRKVTTTGDVKVRVRLQPNGLLTVDAAYATETYEVEETPAPAVSEKKEGEKDEAAAAAAASAPPAKPVMKTKQRRIELTVTPEVDILGHPCSRVIQLRKQEEQMSRRDAEIIRCKEARNDLESYILDTRSRIADGGDLAPYVTKEDQATFLQLGTEYEDWLYDEGSDAAYDAYASRMTKLRDIGAPATRRLHVHEEVPYAVGIFESKVTAAKKQALNTIGVHAHIPEEELRAMAAKCDDAIVWVREKLSEFQAASKTAAPVIMPSDIKARQEDLETAVRVLIKRPAPPKEKADSSSSTAAEAPSHEQGAGMENEATANGENGVPPPVPTEEENEVAAK